MGVKWAKNGTLTISGLAVIGVHYSEMFKDWVFHCQPCGFMPSQKLRARSLAAAKAEALRLVRERLLAVVKELEGDHA